MTNEIVVKGIFYKGVRLFFNHSLVFKPCGDIGYRNEYLDLHVFNENFDNINQEIAYDIFVMYDVYTREDDKKLTEKAREIKYKLIDLISDVDYVGVNTIGIHNINYDSMKI
ncbi:MAG: hypothetical protein ACOCQD_00345 [archaeon]